jgi:2-haloacid dehalogenase
MTLADTGAMRAPTRPHLVLLDVNETLSDLSPLNGAFEAAGLPGPDADAWFAGVLLDGMALALLGRNTPFAEVAANTLEARLVGAGVTDPRTAVERVMRTFAHLRPHPDVAPGLLGLADLGCRVVTLSNGSADVGRSLLAGTAAEPAVEEYLSVEDAPRWKPAPEAYRYALDRTGVDAHDAMLVAAHPWDLAGAQSAGVRTAWINRSDARFPAHFPPPDIEASSFTDLAGRLA